MEHPTIPSVQQLRRISVRATGLKSDQLGWLTRANCVCFPNRHAACGPFTLVVFPQGAWRQEIPRADASHSAARSFLIGLPNGEIIEEVTRPEQHSLLFFDRLKTVHLASPLPRGPEPVAAEPAPQHTIHWRA